MKSSKRTGTYNIVELREVGVGSFGVDASIVARCYHCQSNLDAISDHL